MKFYNYDAGIPNYGDVFTVEEFKSMVADGVLIDYDGHGRAAQNGNMDSIPTNLIFPSQVDEIPDSATHIVWFNR